jgi:hypothetical protein
VSREGGKPKRNEFTFDNDIDKLWQLGKFGHLATRQFVEDSSSTLQIAYSRCNDCIILVSPHKRFAFPDAIGSIGFAMPSSSPEIHFTDTAANSYLYWDSIAMVLKITDSFVVVGDLGKLNRCLDIV